jgi:DNA-binding NtrC family response regulator
LTNKPFEKAGQPVYFLQSGKRKQPFSCIQCCWGVIDTMPIKRTIFLVDDDAAVCHALSVLLEASGYSVRSFLSAETFLEEAEDVAEGVILLDQCMTGMSGLELQAELARRGIALSIIFITGHGDVQMSVKAIKACEFECRKLQCAMGDWEKCARRLRSKGST